jgi:hypothetical protein
MNEPDARLSCAAAENMVFTAPQSREVSRIAPDGALFWNGREVTTDDEFKAAMLELLRCLRGRP